MRQVRSISRKDWNRTESRILRDHMPSAPAEQREVKIWSDLHGDMQSQAEMTWPTTPGGVGGNKSVGPYPMQPQET